MVSEVMMAWQPPPTMRKPVADGWRAFYRHAFLTYGVTPKFYRALYLAQSGRCFICRKARGVHPDDPRGMGTRRLGVDHNHLLGNRIEAVRGLLCTGGDKTCNRVIGWLNVHQLQRAVSLLNHPPAQVLRAAGADDLPDHKLTGWLI